MYPHMDKKKNLGQTPSVWLLHVSGMSCAYSKELDKGKHLMGQIGTASGAN